MHWVQERQKKYVGIADKGILHDSTAIHSLLHTSSDLSTFLEQSGHSPSAFSFSSSRHIALFPSPQFTGEPSPCLSTCYVGALPFWFGRPAYFLSDSMPQLGFHRLVASGHFLQLQGRQANQLRSSLHESYVKTISRRAISSQEFFSREERERTKRCQLLSMTSNASLLSIPELFFLLLCFSMDFLQAVCWCYLDIRLGGNYFGTTMVRFVEEHMTRIAPYNVDGGTRSC